MVQDVMILVIVLLTLRSHHITIVFGSEWGVVFAYL